MFVAENARYRVRRFDRDGKQLNEWGKSEREGFERNVLECDLTPYLRKRRDTAVRVRTAELE